MQSSGHYREQASRARRLARSVYDRAASDTLERMARDYHIAEDLERGLINIPHPELFATAAGLMSAFDSIPQETRMTEVETDQLRQLVERTCGGRATLAQSVSVSEIEGTAVWDGVVHVFDLEHCPTTTRAYAWSSPVEGNPKRQLFATPHSGTIDSPAAAVRAAIAEERRSRKRKS
jgi:hypothetical protein